MAKKKPKKQAASGGSRRDRLASFEAAQKKEQRKRTVILITVCVVLAGLLLAYPVSMFVSDLRLKNTPRNELGASLAEAGCAPAEENPATGNQEHVPDGTPVDYDRLPPDSGPHYNHWAPFTTRFYAPEDRPDIQELVHNLEHGYTIVWYNPDMDSQQVKELRQISRTFGDEMVDKFIAAPWTEADGAPFPDGTNLTMTRWYANPENPANAAEQKGVRQNCGQVSGEALAQFMEDYPQASSPEPNGG